MEELTIKLKGSREIAGFIEAANRSDTTPENLCMEYLYSLGKKYADTYRIGIITTSSFISRFAPIEYASIMEASVIKEDFSPKKKIESEKIQSLINQITSLPTISLDDPRIRPGLEYLVDIGLLSKNRVEEILYYEIPSRKTY